MIDDAGTTSSERHNPPAFAELRAVSPLIGWMFVVTIVVAFVVSQVTGGS